MWNEIAQHIAEVTGSAFEIANARSLGGGCINDARKVTSPDGTAYFVKTNAAPRLDMFEAEADALREMQDAQAIRVPVPVCHGTAGSSAYLVLEYIDMSRSASAGHTQALMGQQLAALHQTIADTFGWHRDNTIGSTPQINTRCDDWIGFYRTHRLQYQLDLAARNGMRFPKASRLLDRLDDFFEDYDPEPSLLHGDLWGGNASADPDGNPLIFDPATYYGDRETDLAFTEMFGGFTPEFYRAYHQAWPLHEGYPARKPLYNLYHLLNHYNIFGGSYGSQAAHVIDHLTLPTLPQLPPQ